MVLIQIMDLRWDWNSVYEGKSKHKLLGAAKYKISEKSRHNDGISHGQDYCRNLIA